MKTLFSFTFILLLSMSSFSNYYCQHKKEVTMHQEMISIDIWSDIVCPFCYVGKKKLEKAIHQLELTDKIVIQWHSFELAPDFPKGQSMPSTQFLTEKRGYPPAQLQKAQEHLTRQGREYGIDFRFEKSLSFNTFDVHRLWQWSKTLKKDTEFKEAFMYAYFTEGIDLSKQENVLNVITKLGLNREKAAEILESNLFAQEVRNDQQQAAKLGIGGVPYFIIQGKQVISGAQDDRVFENALKGVIKNLSSSESGGSCTPTGICD